MDYKLADTIQKIILFNITKRTDNFVYPMYSSSEKQNKVFVHDSEDDIWKVIDITNLNKFVKKIQDELNKYSIVWKSKNKSSCNAECGNLCQQAIKKLNTISYTQDAFMNRVRYDLRVQLQYVCNYEFL
jgi:dTDP-4-dehydrorhamnose reductase